LEDFPTTASRRALAPGEVIWEAGEPSQFVLCLEAGTLEVVQHSLQGEDAVINRLAPGEVAGEMSCLDGQPHSATLRAAVPSVIRVLDRSGFLLWLKESPERSQMLLLRQSQRIRSLSRRLAEVSFEPVQLRLARFLLEQPPGPIQITQQQLAEYLAATRESVSKALNHFVRQGWARTQRGQMQVCEASALRSLIDQFGS
jgi:CRP/FNR family cyclic AMP-dependent transcriptional regulator